MQRIFFAILSGGAALIFLGIAADMIAETIGIITGGPTISSTVHNAISNKPGIAIGVFTGAMILFGALASHFFDWRP